MRDVAMVMWWVMVMCGDGDGDGGVMMWCDDVVW
jgi:hypothetical protein